MAQASLLDPQLQRVKLVASASEAFDPGNSAHEVELQRLFRAAWPEASWEGSTSDRWIELGFQQRNALSDLRGAGLGGVRNLTYFLTHRAAEADQVRRAGPNHCLAIAGLNVTLLLRHYLALHPPGARLQPVVPGGGEKLASAAVQRAFWAWSSVEEQCIEELHAVFLAAMLDRWCGAIAQGWTLLDFPELLLHARQHIEATLPALCSQADGRWSNERLRAMAKLQERTLIRQLGLPGGRPAGRKPLQSVLRSWTAQLLALGRCFTSLLAMVCGSATPVVARSTQPPATSCTSTPLSA